MISIIRLLLLLSLWLFVFSTAAQSTDIPTGAQIMQEVQRRYLLDSNIYEELTVILTDRLGNRDTRNMRRYSRTDVAGNTKLLLMFDTPVDVHGVALLANRDSGGQTSVMLYLPASGRQEMQQIDPGADGNIISTDFSLEQMLGEQPQHYQYVLGGQQKINNINYYLVDAYAADRNIDTTRPTRRHYVREDGYFISRTDYLDPEGRLLKQKTLYDLKQTGPESWHAGMVLMENLAEDHRTLLKINRAIFSDEYVPDDVFNSDWLYRNQPPMISAPTIEAEVDPGLIAPAVESGAR